jgi:hypothetical protein
MARATPSMSALTKLSVTGSPRKRAALGGFCASATIGVEPSSTIAADAVAPALRSQVARGAQGLVILIRSK